MNSIGIIITKIWIIFVIFDKQAEVASQMASKQTEAKFCKMNCGIRPNSVCNGLCRQRDCKLIDPDTEWRFDILKLHNEKRQSVASGVFKELGKARDMNVLSYDMDLEYIASCWVRAIVGKEPEIKRDLCPKTPKFAFVNQNVWKGPNEFKQKEVNTTAETAKPVEVPDQPKTTTTTTEHPAKHRKRRNDGNKNKTNEDKIKLSSRVVNDWFGENENLTKDRIGSFDRSEPIVDNIAQMLWSRTTHIGCGRCKTGTTTYVACNYGIGGNLVRSYIYQFLEGDDQRCTGKGTNEYYPSLCGKISYPSGFFTKGLSTSCQIQIMKIMYCLALVNTLFL